jgi:hypothetical protein
MIRWKVGARLVKGVVLCSLLAVGVAAGAQAPATTAKAPTAGAPLEATGTYRGYSGKWLNLWMENGKRLRFEVDDRQVPDWRKKFRFGEQVTVSYRDLGSRHLPLAVGIKKVETPAPKKTH